MATRKTTAKAKEPTAPTTEEPQAPKTEDVKETPTEEPTAPKAETPQADKPKADTPKPQAKPQADESQPKATGKEYQCMWQVNHNGNAYMAGETINLDPQTAKDLLEGGAIKELA